MSWSGYGVMQPKAPSLRWQSRRHEFLPRVLRVVLRRLNYMPEDLIKIVQSFCTWCPKKQTHCKIKHDGNYLIQARITMTFLQGPMDLAICVDNIWLDRTSREGAKHAQKQVTMETHEQRPLFKGERVSINVAWNHQTNFTWVPQDCKFSISLLSEI